MSLMLLAGFIASASRLQKLYGPEDAPRPIVTTTQQAVSSTQSASVATQTPKAAAAAEPVPSLPAAQTHVRPRVYNGEQEESD
jgi:hypothetical protein